MKLIMESWRRYLLESSTSDISDDTLHDALDYAAFHGPAGNNPYLSNIEFVKNAPDLTTSYGAYRYPEAAKEFDQVEGFTKERLALKIYQKFISNAFGVLPGSNPISPEPGLIRIELANFQKTAEHARRIWSRPANVASLRNIEADVTEDQEPNLEPLIQIAVAAHIGSTIVHEIQHNIDVAASGDRIISDMIFKGMSTVDEIFMRSAMPEQFKRKVVRQLLLDAWKEIVKSDILRQELSARRAQQKYWNDLLADPDQWTEREKLVLNWVYNTYFSGKSDAESKGWHKSYDLVGFDPKDIEEFIDAVYADVASSKAEATG